jgi:hypothetical protein
MGQEGLMEICFSLVFYMVYRLARVPTKFYFVQR